MTQELYTQLRLALLEPGEEWGGYRRPYAPVNVNKDDWTFDYMLTQPDTPRIAYLRTRYEYGSMATVGMRGVRQ